ncbi:MAG: class I SAM-dependent methyltransferase [Hyphomicrobiales bacterium]|nr:class I SAM-dependent methyltransferase [Hyphomicrobiales bacterium]
MTKIDNIASSERPLSEKFTLIYENKLWVKSAPHLNREKSASGHGSTLRSTQTLRPQLEELIKSLKPASLFDVPCGDFNWMKEVRFPNDCDYVGADVVAPLIDRLQQRYGYEAGASPRDRGGTARSRRFLVFDLCSDPLPPFDILFCKDCLQHLSNSDVQRVIENIVRSEVKYVMISNHWGVESNKNVPTGGFRFLDLTKPPFMLPEPAVKLNDRPVDQEPRYIGVWRREELARR